MCGHGSLRRRPHPGITLDSAPAGLSLWLGWVVSPDRQLVFVLDRGQDRSDLVRQSLGIGYEALAGEVAGGVDAWRDDGRPVTATALTRTAVAGPVLDVRQASEFGMGHVRGAGGIELGPCPVALPISPSASMSCAATASAQ